MKKKFLSSLAILTLSGVMSVQAQTVTFKQHRVNKGETLTDIAKQYSVGVKDILKYNPEVESGLQEKAVLLIPVVSNSEKGGISTVTSTSKNHLVESKETLYGISKKYQISIDELYRLNPGLKENGLKSGEIIHLEPAITAAVAVKPIAKLDTLVASSAQVVKEYLPSNTKTIVVGPKETVYGLAIEYQTSIQQLYELNPLLKTQGLVEGQALIVPSKKEPKETLKVNDVKTTNTVTYKEIVVEPKETIFNLSKEYQISPEQLLALNPELSYGLRVGMTLKVPGSASEKGIAASGSKTTTYSSGSYKDLTRSLDKNKSKELVLLLPFNAHKINIAKDDIQEKLKKDAFLNMTLDFYSGALIAIDSAKTLGLPLKVRIYDSKETSSTSEVSNLFSSENFSATDVIIGPFFQKNVIQTAALIKESKVVLVSPLSTEKGKSGPNLIQTMPNSDDLKRYMVDYMLSQKGKIVVIVDEKKTSTKSFLQQNYPNIKVLNGSEASKVADYLSTSTKNFVILDTGSIQTALSTTNALISKLATHDIQLATFDKNEVFDYTEISLNALTKLKLMYASVTRENESENGTRFAKMYKKENNIYPNRYATRGFDVTFDVISRMFQNEDFEETISKYTTQQVENKFAYSTVNGGVYNQGVYLLYYDEDLTVKIIK
ncbi:LysM peptidoglycan-binding domain-containing protein [Flavobacterium sp. NKUCC04_CG]|uniref:LysM peptidoglycan-binding domain-containing protein n=1 Tax=Flavobacterium sp. NKUCC04_CG TaxID=2842121 RepID=UPI001C5B8A63|nr:LysM peptidoglycan-binding domain-containing protein [Flavobacterium sp. NKUCC04_CG]MBW3518713.1 LysM peptidoglycan-binding domain-containing protein [Flavobacterium sp. NKUCC04_CG]